MTAVANPNTCRHANRDLPTNVSVFYAWQDDAACRGGAIAQLFFAPDSERIRERQARETAAKRVCGSCPVRQQCLEHATSFPERAGVWGGLTEEERDTDARKAKRAQDKARWARRQEQQDGQVAA